MANVFLVHTDAGVAQVIKDALASKPDLSLVGQAASGGEALAKFPSANANILLLQIRLPDADGFSLIQQFRQKNPAVFVVPILQGNEAGDVWQKILQLNLRDVMVPPFTVQSVMPILQQAASHAATMEPVQRDAGGYVVAVASARGGVGKSIFATNLAISMAQQKADVMLVDYSMNAGDFFTMLDQVPRNTMADAISQGMGLDSTLLKNLMGTHQLGFDFLACPNDEFDFYGFDGESAKHLLQESRQLKEYVVVDTGAYDLPPTNAAIESADVVFMVTTRDLARLMALQRWIKGLTERGADPDKFKVIVNNAEVGSEISENEIEEVLGHPITAYLPSCPAEATFSVNSGKPMLQVKGDHPFCSVIDKLAEYSIQKWADV